MHSVIGRNLSPACCHREKIQGQFPNVATLKKLNTYKNTFSVNTSAFNENCNSNNLTLYESLCLFSLEKYYTSSSQNFGILNSEDKFSKYIYFTQSKCIYSEHQVISIDIFFRSCYQQALGLVMWNTSGIRDMHP